jgi:hypothetical protein
MPIVEKHGDIIDIIETSPVVSIQKKGAEMSRNEQIMLMQDCRGLELVSTQKLRRRLSIKPMLYTHIIYIEIHTYTFDIS